MSNAHRLSLYWVVAMAAGYVATVLYYRWRDRTSGVVASVWPFFLTGAALFVLLILVSPDGLALIGLSSTVTPWFVVGDLFIRGLTPVLTITFIGGPSSLIDQILGEDQLEAFPAGVEDPLAGDPLPAP